MIWRWLICFSFLARIAPAADVAGRVELTGTTTKDLSGVAVWLEPGEEAKPGVHATMTQKNKTFVPHILVAQAGTTVDFPNLDPIFHNAFSSFDGEIFDVGLYPPGKSRSVRFDREGVVRVFCNIHPAMSAVIVVVKTPWFAVSGRNGGFRMEGVPPGEYTLRVYHERATRQTLDALTRRVSVTEENGPVAVITISETGYLPGPHKNKYGKDYPNPIVYSEHQP